MAKKAAAAGPSDGPWALPDGWRWERLGRVGRWGSGGTPDVKNARYYGGHIPWFRSGELLDGPLGESEIKITHDGLRESSAKLVEPGAVLVAMYGATVGKLAISTGVCATNQAIAFCIPDPTAMTPDYLFYYLLSIRPHLRARAQGGAQPNISQTVLKEQVIPVPPVEQQRRIIARIDELFADIDDGEAALARARADLTTWRKALLKAAVTGELTTDWRAANSPTETGADLLARILAERRARWEVRKGKRNAALPLPETEGLPELPDSWTWATLEQVASSEANAIADGPFGSNLKSSHYTDQGPRVLRLQNIGRDGSFIDATAHIGQSHFENLGRHHVKAGDLVIAILGEPVPRAAIVPPAVGPALVKADCIKVRLDEKVSARLIWTWLNSIVAHFRFEHEVKGVGRPRLSMAHVRGMPVPIAPTDEQSAITQRVEAGLLSIAEAAQAIADQEIAAATLRQSILAAAFRGELA